MKITPRPPVGTPSPLSVESLQDAARVALSASEPLRAWRGSGRDRQELFFFRDLVLHAAAGGCRGVGAVRRMLAEQREPFSLQIGRWPRQHTMLVEWSHLLAAAKSAPKRRRVHDEPARYADPTEATVPLRGRVLID